MHPKCFCQEQVDGNVSINFYGKLPLLTETLSHYTAQKKIMKQLPILIQIISCANHYDWYEQWVYEKFKVVDINEEEQTYTVITYDGYGRLCLEEVNISDCKILGQ